LGEFHRRRLQIGNLPLRDIKHEHQRAAPFGAAGTGRSRRTRRCQTFARPPWVSFRDGGLGVTRVAWRISALRATFLVPCARHRAFQLGLARRDRLAIVSGLLRYPSIFVRSATELQIVRIRLEAGQIDLRRIVALSEFFTLHRIKERINRARRQRLPYADMAVPKILEPPSPA